MGGGGGGGHDLVFSQLASDLDSVPKLSICLYFCLSMVLTYTFGASCYNARLSWALVLTWVSPFVQDKKKELSLGWGKNRLSRYDIRAEGALPPSITVIARLKNCLGYWICNVSLKKINSEI